MRTIFFLAFLFFSALQITAQNPEALRFGQLITAEKLYEHLKLLASDEFEGRETGKPGQRRTALYIMEHFKSIGLQGPTSHENRYFQSFNLYHQKLLDMRVILKKKQLILFKDVLPLTYFDFSGDVELVFAGYGIEHEKYNDYNNLNVEGKMVVVLDGEPRAADGNFVISGNSESSPKARPQTKASTAKAKKAIGIIILMDDELFNRSASNARARMTSNQMSFETKKNEFMGIIMKKTSAAPIFGVRPKKISQAILNVANRKAGLSLTKIQINSQKSKDLIQTENVMGLIEGTDKKEEVLVITAHMDHIGIINGQINNGADDDGSGTVCLLEIARAFAAAVQEGIRPRRSILFLSVTGEEKGLLGSAFYAQNPIFPLENTIANLNIDMVGRVDDQHLSDTNYVYVIGTDMLSTDLHRISEKTQADYQSPIRLDYRYNSKNDPEQFYYRSDHYNFAKNNIPVIFYFTGVHPDYHRPGDDVEKIMFGKMTHIARLIFYTAWELANAENRPAIDKLNE